MTDAALREALGALLPDHAFECAAPLGRGHIHQTYRVRCRDRDGGPAEFVVQRVNHHVFRDPEGLARNLERVTAHLWSRQRARGAADPERRCLRPVRSPSGRTLERSADGRSRARFAASALG